MHAHDEKELLNKHNINLLLKNNYFETVIFLKQSKNPGEILKIKKVSELI